MPKAKKLPSGSWRCQVYLGKDENGKNIYKSVTADTKKEAEYLAAQMQMEKKRIERAEMTVGDAYDKYIEIKSNVLSPNTIREYRRTRQKDLQELMPIKLSDLSQEAIQAAINNYALTHSPKSTRNVHGILSGVMKVYAPDLTIRATLPQKEKYDRYIPTDSDISKILKEAQGTAIEVPIMLAAFGSLRRGEIAALLPEDVTDSGVYVKRAEYVDANRKIGTKPPKSFKGYRFTELPNFVIAALKKWEYWGISMNKITKDFPKICKKANVHRCRFHDLRHYYASSCHAMGIPDKYIMERGGWSSNAVLQTVYQHTMQEQEKKVSQQIVSHFEKFSHDISHEISHDNENNKE